MTDNYKVYIHTFLNGKHYVGITKQDVNKRWKYGAGYEKEQPYIYNAIKKYGWKNIYHTVLYENLSLEEALEKEVYLIAILRSNDRAYGYNISVGGFYNAMSDETRKKISKSRKGIKFSDEHIKNLSESHKGYKPTDIQNYKDMMSNPKRKPVVCIETQITYNSIREAGRLTGINYRAINSVCNHEYGRHTAGGYHWEYASEKGSD